MNRRSEGLRAFTGSGCYCPVMPVPERIPIKRVPHYRTYYAGRWARGQFLGTVISQLDRWAVEEGKANWRGYSRWFAYPHEFDHHGRYLESAVESPGLGPQARTRRSASWRNGSRAFPGSPTATSRSGRSAPNTSAWPSASSSKRATGRTGPMLSPESLGFHEPWDGEYDT